LARGPSARGAVAASELPAMEAAHPGQPKFEAARLRDTEGRLRAYLAARRPERSGG